MFIILTVAMSKFNILPNTRARAALTQTEKLINNLRILSARKAFEYLVTLDKITNSNASPYYKNMYIEILIEAYNSAANKLAYALDAQNEANAISINQLVLKNM